MIIPASDIQFVENHAPLGHGKFGSVQIARYRERELVAVKSLKCEGGTSDPLDSLSLFINEAKLMKLLNHRRIVAFMGFSVELLAIILEFSPFGPLSSFISASKLLESRDWPQIQQLAADIAEGMRFLHSDFYPSTSERKVQFFHQDLKPSNVLLFPEESDPTSPSRLLRAKITDFGISVKRKGQLKTASSTMTFTAHAGSIVLQAKNNSIYQAPELASTENFTKRCDVFSYGVVVFEMIVLLPPTEYPASFPASNSASAPDVLKTAIMKCLSLSPLKRPLFPEVCLWLGLQDLEVQQKSQLMPATTPTITNTGDFKHYSLVPPTHEHSENKYPYTRYRPNDNVPTFNSIDGISLQDISPKQIQRFELFYEHEDNQFSPMRLAIDKKRRQLAAFTTRLIRRKKMLIICVVLVATLVLSISMILVFTSKSSASSATFTDDSRSSLQVVQSSTTTTPAQLFYPYTSAAGTASCEWNGIALFGFEDGMTLKLDLTTGALDRAFNSSIVARTGAAASSISIDENSGYICLIYNDGTVVMADLFSLTVSSIGGNGNNNPPSSSHSSSFCRQKLLYTFSNYNLVTSWDLFQNSPSNHLVQKYSYDSNDKVTSMTQGRNRFFVGTAGGAVWMSQLWSTSSGNQTLVAQGSGGSILFLQYHGSYVYSLNEAGIISLIHMYDFNISATLQLPNSVVQNGVVDFGVTDLFIYILTKTAGVFQVDPTEKKIMLLPFSIGGGSSTNMIISARHIYISGSLGGVFRIRIGVGSAKRDAELIGSTFFTRKMFSDHGAMFAEQGNGQVMRANLLLNNTEFVYNSSSSNLQPSTSIYSERASGFSCISYLNGVVSSFDGETVNWWYELETGVEQTDRSVVCQFPFVLFNQGTQFLRYKFYSPTYSYNVKLVSNHTFANKISALALGNDRIYLGDSAGSVAEYIISTDSIVTIIDGIAAQSTGVSFLRYCGTNLYVFYSNNSVAKIHTQSQSISYLKQLLPSLNIKITSITDVAVDADGIFIATGAVVYQTLEKTPEEVVVIYTNNNVSQLLVQNEYAYLATYNGVYILQLE